MARVKTLWERLHDMHPSKNPGLRILDYISSTEGLAKEVKPQRMNLNYPPTGAELIEDLITHNTFFNHLTGESYAKLDWIKFLKGWEAMKDYANPLMEAHIRCKSTTSSVNSTTRRNSCRNC